jgi:hypothetical protein
MIEVMAFAGTIDRRNDLPRVVPAKAGTQQIREHIEGHGFRLSPE